VKYLKIFLLWLALMQCKALAQDDKEKWQFIEKNFATELSTLKWQQKFGKILNNYSAYIVWPLALFGVALSMELLDDNNLIRLIHRNSKNFAKIFFNTRFTSTYDPNYRRKVRVEQPSLLELAIEGFIYGFIVFGIPAMCYFLPEKILELIGKKLENKDGRCLQLLSDFVKNWDENKEKSPEELKRLFEMLATGENLSKIDKARAQKIVESVIDVLLSENLVQ
jgi:hypothetical protein